MENGVADGLPHALKLALLGSGGGAFVRSDFEAEDKQTGDRESDGAEDQCSTDGIIFDDRPADEQAEQRCDDGDAEDDGVGGLELIGGDDLRDGRGFCGAENRG